MVYFRTRPRTGEESLDTPSWNIKTLSNKNLHRRKLQGKTPQLNTEYTAKYKNGK
jgi:hypothetical protein